MKEGCEEMRVVNFDGKFDEDVLVAKATLLEAGERLAILKSAAEIVIGPVYSELAFPVGRHECRR